MDYRLTAYSKGVSCQSILILKGLSKSPLHSPSKSKFCLLE